MAKKKQKAHNIVPDQLSDRQLVKREFEESRQLLLDLQRERPEQKLHQKTILTGMEFVEPMLSRRIRAATNYMPVLRKRYEKYTHITPADYAFYLSLISLTQNENNPLTQYGKTFHLNIDYLYGFKTCDGNKA